MQELQVDKELKKLETDPAWHLEKVKSKKEVVLEAQRDNKSPTLMDMCHLKNAELEPKLQKIQRQSRAPWCHCKRRLWSPCSFCWTGLVCVPNDCCKSNGCYCMITRLWRTSSWCSICVHSSKTGGRLQFAQYSKVRMSRCMDTSSTTQMAEILVKHWRSCGTSRTKFIRRHPLAGFLWERQFEEILLELGWEKVQNWECLFCFSTTIIILIGVRGWFLKWLESSRIWLPRGRNWCKTLLSWKQLKIFRCVTPHAKTVAWSYDMEGRARKCVERYWRAGTQESGATVHKFQVLAWMTINSSMKNLNQLENYHRCLQIVLKCLYLARIGRLDILLSANKLACAVTRWTRACTTRVITDNIVMWATLLSIVD